MTVHVITNYAVRSGAELMLARLLSDPSAEPSTLVSLMSISADNARLLEGTNTRLVALGASGTASMLNATLKLSRFFRREQPETVMCWMYHAAVAGTVALALSRHRARLIWNVRQSLDDVESFSRSMRTAVALARPLSGRADTIVYNSERARLLHARSGYEDRRGVVIPNGFTVAQQPPPVAGGQARRFGIAGRLHPQKDHGTFFKAVAIARRACPQARFVAVGRGLEPGNGEVLALLKEAGLTADDVELRGEQTDMASFYKSIDVLVLSSRTEGFPNVVAESMRLARPCIATDVGDAARIVGESGLVVPPRDPAALASAIETFAAMSDEEYKVRAGQALARVRSDYSIGKIQEMYAQLLQSPSQRLSLI